MAFIKRFFQFLKRKLKSTDVNAEIIKSNKESPQLESSPMALEKRDTGKDNYSCKYANQSRRDADMAAESELAAFLDEYLYTPLLAEGHFQLIQRVHEKAQQLQGVDVVVSTKTTTGNIDEKAQLYYLNKNLPTFAFELQFMTKGVAMEGWFLNDSLLTDFYLLIWPQASTDSVYEIKKEKFTRIDALMVSKKKLRQYVSELGLTKDALKSKAIEIRQNHMYGKTPSGKKGVYYYLSDSKKYVEAPINLVVSKTILLKLATAHYEVTPNGFERIRRT